MASRKQDFMIQEVIIRDGIELDNDVAALDHVQSCKYPVIQALSVQQIQGSELDFDGIFTFVWYHTLPRMNIPLLISSQEKLTCLSIKNISLESREMAQLERYLSQNHNDLSLELQH